MTITPAILAVPIITDRWWVHAPLAVIAFVGIVLNLVGASPIGG